MTRAVVVVQANVPQVLPSEGVEAVPDDLVGEDGRCKADLAFEDPGEGLFFERLRSSEVDSPMNKKIKAVESHNLISGHWQCLHCIEYKTLGDAPCCVINDQENKP